MLTGKGPETCFSVATVDSGKLVLLAPVRILVDLTYCRKLVLAVIETDQKPTATVNS